MAGTNLTVLQSKMLDMVAEGKTPRQIEARLGVPASQVHRMTNELLDAELDLDTESKRKLQVFRLEKITEALYPRVMANADRDDVKNMLEIIDRTNDLLALHKERDTEEIKRVSEHQLALYVASLKQLIVAFKVIAPNLMTEAEWDQWTVAQLQIAQQMLQQSNGQLEIDTNG